MSYQALARKWRPKRFADLVGQEHVVRALANALGNGRLHHAYLLTGTRGVGKTTLARILAKCLNCETGITADPCGKCSASDGPSAITVRDGQVPSSPFTARSMALVRPSRSRVKSCCSFSL